MKLPDDVLAEIAKLPATLRAVVEAELAAGNDVAEVLHGQAETAFDWDQRPFFLTFNTQDPTARRTAFRELCRKIGVDAQRYLEPG
jgi:hypothetical protein